MSEQRGGAVTGVAPDVHLTRRVWLPAALGLAALVLAVVAALVTRDAGGFFRGYLLAYTFWVGLGLGCMGVAFAQFLTGGIWGLATRRVFEAGAATLPLLAVLFVPLLFGLPELYLWARPEAVAASPVLQHKAPYLNVPFFVVRSVVYFACWVVLARLLLRWSSQPRRVQRLSIVGVLLLGVTVSFAAIDWLMSLDAEWFSTMYPPLVAMGDLLVALAFAIVVVSVVAPPRELLTPGLLNDLGSLLLAFLMLWGYMAYFQYLLIWAGNLTDEIPWYLRRIEGGWLTVALLVAVGGFVVPFCLLLFRPLKRNRGMLAAIAGLLVVMHVVDVFWLVEPPFTPAGPLVSLTEVLGLVGIGALWLAVFSWQLAARPLVPSEDPRAEPALEAARAGA